MRYSRFIFAIPLLFLSSFLFAASVPKWVKDTDKVYPQSQFLRAIGEGKNLKIAQDSAVAAISLVFDTKSEVRNAAIKELSCIQEENKTEYASSQKAVQVVNIKSDSDFFCTKFDEPYIDKKTKNYSVIAYINRSEAGQIYKERIGHIMSLVRKLDSAAEKDSEPLRKISDWGKALSLGQLAETYINNAVIINPSDTDIFKADLRLLEEITGKFLEKKPEMLFSVSCKNEGCESVVNHIRSLLENKGCTCTENDFLYDISIEISFSEEHLQTGEFVRPTIHIQFKNREGKTIKSYSKSYTRYGAKTMEMAYSRAKQKIQEDLTENLLSEF